MQAIFENLPLWWQGMGMTLLLTGVVTLIGLPIGILLAGMRVSPVAALRVVAAVWTEVARNTPLTLVFFFTAFVLPKLGINVIIALTKNTSVAMGFFVFVLTSVAQRLSNVYGDQALQVFIGIAFSYLLITVPLGQLVDHLERKWSVQR